jgi:glucose/arabinose dehydrogenase
MANFNGTPGADDLRGTKNGDSFNTDTGPDSIKAGKGDDVISGGGGDDLVKGGVGNDLIFGFSSADTNANSGAIGVVEVGSGLSVPVFATSAPGDPGRLFVVEKGGDIEILDLATGAVSATPFLDLAAGDISTSGERGLLGLAFAPDYVTSGKVYVDVTNAAGDIEIREYTRDSSNPDRLDASTKQVLLTIEHSAEDNHNGGWVGFGPDGYLYITVGDGGGSGDQDNSAQDLNELTGKLLRIAPDGNGGYDIPDDNPFANSAGLDEIYSYGLRNPFRMSFDAVTGDAWIGDVGQGAYEEIDFIAGGAGGGQNFGWHVKEGDHVYDPNDPGNPDPDDPSLIDPLLEYGHVAGPYGGNVVTGGYVYRGPGAGAQGLYFFADYGSNNLWTVREVDGGTVDFINRNGQLQGDAAADFRKIASFAEDGAGNLYGVTITGQILRLDPSEAAGDGSDKLSGGEGADSIYGGAGADSLAGGVGDDVISGGLDRDVIAGDAGADVLSGGRNPDLFLYRSLADSALGAADRITDLSDNDVIDLRAIDAKSTKDGNQAFELVDQFTAEAGQLTMTFQAGQARTLLRVDVDGDAISDMTVIIDGDKSAFDSFVL